VSWGLAAALVIWGAREPRLDRMRRELEHLEVADDASASDWLVAELGRELGRSRRLRAKLAGDTGARALEARRDGSTVVPHFHVVIGDRTTGLSVTSSTGGQLELSHGGESLSVPLAPGRAVVAVLPVPWRGQGFILDAVRSGGTSMVIVRGRLEDGA
jgi:hypothetical protein